MDQLIHEGGLRITDVEPLAHQGLLVVMLNTGSPLMVRTALFPRLATATAAQLDEWEIIADGTAIGWDAIDEHLSLKGFLTAEVRNEVMDRLRSRLAQGVKHRMHQPASAKRTRTKGKPKVNAR